MIPRISSVGMPTLASLATTSDRFTALTAAPAVRLPVTWSAPGSPFSMASSAEASRTTLLTLILRSPLRDQHVHQRLASGDILSHKFLSSPHSLARSEKPELSILNLEYQVIPDLQAQLPSNFGRDNDPTPFSYPYPHPCLAFCHSRRIRVQPGNHTISTLRTMMWPFWHGGSVLARPLWLVRIYIAAGYTTCKFGTRGQG